MACGSLNGKEMRSGDSMKMFRQGDLLFVKIDSIPKDMIEIKNNVILRGEATRHSHRLVNGQLFRERFLQQFSEKRMFIKAEQHAKIIHEEHATLELEVGFYAVIRQMEYNPWRITAVVD